MKPALVIARKEWKGAFLSPVALIFLSTFLLASLFVLFFAKGFFGRGIADVRPFLQWMPVLLAFLAAAFTMRLWSEEARSGTLELLMTQPVRIRDLVLGKFLAGLGLATAALLLTLPVPVTIEILGDLDWGPVIGGYLGLLLLSGAYLAIGMFVSSLTANALVALLMSLVACGLFVLVGVLPDLVSLGVVAGDALRALGTWSRFESMLRGVLDLGDLVYYLSLCVLFLALNGLVLEVRRWGRDARGRSRRRNTLGAFCLLGVNLMVLNAGMVIVRAPRVDLTEWGEYSISPATGRLLQGVSEPLLVRGYFSDKTHPELARLVPRIRDFLGELKAVGGSGVTTEFVDPTVDEDAEREAHGKYGIRSVPFRIFGRHEDTIVNSYFHILVRYGDRHEVLEWEGIIDVDYDSGKARARLRNLEYEVARAVQKAVYGFKSIEAICNQLPDKASLVLIASSKSLPDELKEVPDRIVTAAGEFRERCAGKFEFARLDPDDPGSGVSPDTLVSQFGIEPLTLGFFDDRRFYLHMILEMGGSAEKLNAAAALTESDVLRELEAALKRRSPGFLRTVGVASAGPPPRPVMPGMPPPPGARYRMVQDYLRQTYDVSQVDLESGRVPGEVDVLLVPNPRHLGEKERFAIDQFLMRGGSVVVAGGGWAFEPSPDGRLDVQSVETGLADLLVTYGVEVGAGVVLDLDHAAFPLPVVHDIDGVKIQDIEMLGYPPFVAVHDDGLAEDNPATRALPMVVLQWTSPVRCAQRDDEDDNGKTHEATCRTLLTTSGRAWEVMGFKAQPDFARHPELGFAVPDVKQRIPLAVAVTGPFDSHYQDRQPPLLGDSPAPGPAGEPPEASAKPGRRGGVIQRSEPTARLTVVGSSAFLDDLLLTIYREVSDAHLANMQLVANLADWSVHNDTLMEIRSRERYARALATLSRGEKIAWEIGHFGFVVLAIGIIGLLTLSSRGRARPIMQGGARHKEVSS